ncbi:hypothetical protein GXW78_13665 [Roseomonas terrae]|jgi:hypothetical protein|uniref:Uncharacterized protein n=1 Tax=Neoroseomonas terrae TaxID=424799 RepID=A0ABS5EI66_9PROT|nr:hypothetical protein [Neoroseomonas terrae]MBR0650719.1 hypothetical protein [Neoroseomonas terrae]
MIRFSLFAMVALTILIAMGLRWREQRVAAMPRLGVAGRAKRTVNRWVTAAALAAATTMIVLGGLHWLRIAIG